MKTVLHQSEVFYCCRLFFGSNKNGIIFNTPFQQERNGIKQLKLKSVFYFSCCHDGIHTVVYIFL